MRSSQQTFVAQCLEYHFRERGLRRGAQISPTMAPAEAFDFGAIAQESLAIGLDQIGRHPRARGMAHFGVDQKHFIGKHRFELFGTRYVNGKNVMTVFANYLEAALKTFSIQKVGDHDDQSTGAARAKKTAKCGLQAGAPGGFQALEEMQRSPDLVFAAARRHFLDHAVGKCHQADTIVIDKSDVGDRGGKPAREIELGWRAEGHRAADIDENVNWQIGFLLEQPQDQAIEPEVSSPVEVAGVIARGIGPVVGEDHARPGAARTMMPAQMAGNGTPRKHRKMLELAKKLFADQHAFLNQVELPRCGRASPAFARRGVRYSRGSGTHSRIRARMESESTLCASASKLSNRRCRRAGKATARTSSQDT